MANIFGKECWDLAGEMYDELFPINQPTDINNIVHNTLPEIVDENIVANVVESFESEHIPVVIAINDQENEQNFDQTDASLETPGNSNDGNITGNRQIQNSHNSVDLFLEIPVDHNTALLMSASLPPTPVSIASTSSSPPDNQKQKTNKKML